MKTTTLIRDIVGLRASRRLPAGLPDVVRLSTDEMIERGLTRVQAARLRASLKLAIEIHEPEHAYERERIVSPTSAMRYCQREFATMARHSAQEEFWIVTLDTKNQPINKHQITVGTLRNSLVHPREVFRPAIADAANCILAIHNHPSGDPTPSDQDISVTKRLHEAAEIIGIPVVDHIIVAGEKALSIQEWLGATGR